tara:strand:- start:140 stop:892 length:753 start_codon:yes stop_codon:yes gene_type:complete
MKILICGYGFVGMAHALALQSDHEVHIYDPHKGYDNWVDADAVIIAVSTPEASDGSCFMGNVFECVSTISNDTPILIKSTISIEGWRQLKKDFPKSDVSFSPEFLRAKHAYEDFKNQDMILIGGHNSAFWINTLQPSLGVEFETVDPEELIITKYVRNSFLALKVAFFNQVFDLCENANADYNTVAHYVGMDDRIGYSHTCVSNSRGFGGHCFPKDTAALSESSKQLGITFSILEEAINYNSKVRRSKGE